MKNTFWTIDSVDRFKGKKLCDVQQDIIRKEYSDKEAAVILEEASHYAVNSIDIPKEKADGTPIEEKQFANHRRYSCEADDLVVCNGHFCGVTCATNKRDGSINELLLLAEGTKIIYDDIKVYAGNKWYQTEARYARFVRAVKKVSYVRTLEFGEDAKGHFENKDDAYDVGQREYSASKILNLAVYLFRDDVDGLHLVLVKDSGRDVWDPEGGGPTSYFAGEYLVREQSVDSEEIALSTICDQSFWCNMSSWGGVAMLLSSEDGGQSGYYKSFEIQSQLNRLLGESKNNRTLSIALYYWMQQTGQTLEDFFDVERGRFHG